MALRLALTAGLAVVALQPAAAQAVRGDATTGAEQRLPAPRREAVPDRRDLGDSARGSVGAWQSGRWYRGWHGGRFGWWWTVPGDDWYAYDEPVYPFPQFPQTAYPNAPVAPYYWYYCRNPAGYYPYVAQCTAEWRPVPAPG
ncbi:MAG: hypothetical protein JO032_08185 [Alphaproteobacteria bacterium]|nr:hypothetical protein [Alphaproteobacteria bacterium]